MGNEERPWVLLFRNVVDHHTSHLFAVLYRARRNGTRCTCFRCSYQFKVTLQNNDASEAAERVPREVLFGMAVGLEDLGWLGFVLLP